MTSKCPLSAVGKKTSIRRDCDSVRSAYREIIIVGKKTSIRRDCDVYNPSHEKVLAVGKKTSIRRDCDFQLKLKTQNFFCRKEDLN